MNHNDFDAVKTMLTPPARRLVGEMKMQISEISPGDHIGATFISPTFGVYVMWASAQRACHGDLVLGTSSIETKGNPSNDLLRLDTSGKSVTASGPPHDALGIEHGSIVRATFSDCSSHINIIGPAVIATRSSMIGVGTWILAHGSHLGIHLQALDILAPPGELALKVPAPTISWHDN